MRRRSAPARHSSPPAGSRHAILAGEETLRLLTVLGGVASAAVHNLAHRFFHMHSRWIVEAETAPEAAMIVARNRFEVGGRHALHKHSEAEEYLMVLERVIERVHDREPKLKLAA